MALEGKDTDEALTHLRATLSAFPQARLGVAKILEERGDIAGARIELESYLGTHPAGDTTAVREWLTLLHKFDGGRAAACQMCSGFIPPGR